MKRCGTPTVTSMMPKAHRAIITYIERVQRKQQNKVEKARLRAILGAAQNGSVAEDGGQDKVDDLDSSEQSGDSSAEDANDNLGQGGRAQG